MPKRKRGNGDGTITERPDGRWMGQATTGWDPVERKQARVTVYGSTAREAREKLDAARRKAHEGEAASRDQTVRTFLDFWLLSTKHKVRPSSYERYEKDVGYVLPHLGHRRLVDLAAIHVLKMYEKMETQGHSADARRKAGIILRRALKQAVAMKYLEVNPAGQVALPRVVREEIRPLHPEEVGPFLLACKGRRLEALGIVALDTGARRGELLALEWSDWDPAARELSITKSLTSCHGRQEVGPTKTVSSRRRVQLSPAAAAALEAHRGRMAAEGHLTAPIFCTRTGKHNWPGTLHTHFLVYVLKEAGLPRMRFHDLRHSCATLLLAGGVDIKSIAARLGHANPKQLLQTYAHVLPAMHAKMAAVMDGFLGGAPQREAAPAPVLKIAEVF